MSEGSSQRDPTEDDRERNTEETDTSVQTETPPIADETTDPFEALSEMEGELSDEQVDELFEPVEHSALDDETVWESILADEDEEGTHPSAELDADVVVSKERYCKRCEFFSDPPDVACTNSGTEIVELVGVDRFRVKNCPVVSRRGKIKPVFSDEQ